MRCTTHPDVETNLCCGKCGKPICPKCLVQTPVGARCQRCARLYKLPTYQVSFRHYLRAVGVMLGLAVVCGIIRAALEHFLPPFVGLLLLPGIGYAIGECVSLSVNRKRGIGLAIVAGIGVALSYLVTVLLRGVGFPISPFGIYPDLVAVGVGVYLAVNRLR